MTENEDTQRTRSLREWLRIADFQVAQSFYAAFAAEGVSRREGMLLRRLTDGPIEIDRDKKMRSLEDRGWAHQRGDGTWELTDDGRAVAERLAAKVDELHATMRDAVGADEYEALASSLEAVSRSLGWTEGQGNPWRGFRGRGFAGFPGGAGAPGGFPGGFPGGGYGPWAAHRGFGPGFRGGFPGPWDHGHMHGGGHGYGHMHGGEFGPACGAHGHRGHGHGHGRHGHGNGHGAESAFERGFAAGFAARESA